MSLKHLHLKGNTYYIKMRVPSVLVNKHGKKTFNISTGTDSVREAKRLRDAFLLELEKEKLEAQQDTPATRFKFELERITNAAKNGNNVEESPLFDIDAKTPIETRHAIEQFTGCKDHEKNTYGISLKQALGLELRRIEQTGQSKSLAFKRERAVKYFLTFVGMSDIQLKDITRRQAAEFIDKFIAESKSHKTIRSHSDALSAIWNVAARYGDVDMNANPFKDLKGGETNRESFKPLSLEQIAKLKDRAEGDLRLLIELGIATGARISELKNLKSNDIQTTDKGNVYIDIKKSKTSNGLRQVPIVNSALAERLIKTDGYIMPLFEGKGDTYASGIFRKLKLEIGIEDKSKSFHSFRSGLATDLERAGHNKDTIGSILGHGRNDVTMGTYSQGLTIDQLADVMRTVR